MSTWSIPYSDITLHNHGGFNQQVIFRRENLSRCSEEILDGNSHGKPQTFTKKKYWPKIESCISILVGRTKRALMKENATKEELEISKGVEGLFHLVPFKISRSPSRILIRRHLRKWLTKKWSKSRKGADSFLLMSPTDLRRWPRTQECIFYSYSIPAKVGCFSELLNTLRYLCI